MDRPLAEWQQTLEWGARRSCSCSRKTPALTARPIAQCSAGMWPLLSHWSDGSAREDVAAFPELEEVFLEFPCSESVITESTVKERVSRAGIASERVGAVVSHLVKLTFLGVEVTEGQFSYSDEPKELKKNKVLADRLAGGSGGGRRYEVGPAFRSYLEIRD